MPLIDEVRSMPTRKEELQLLGLKALEEIWDIARAAGVHGDAAIRLGCAIERLCNVKVEIEPYLAVSWQAIDVMNRVCCKERWHE